MVSLGCECKPHVGSVKSAFHYCSCFSSHVLGVRCWFQVSNLGYFPFLQSCERSQTCLSLWVFPNRSCSCSSAWSNACATPNIALLTRAGAWGHLCSVLNTVTPLQQAKTIFLLMYGERLLCCCFCKRTWKSGASVQWLRRGFALTAQPGSLHCPLPQSSGFWCCASSARSHWSCPRKTWGGFFFPEDDQHPGFSQHGKSAEISGSAGSGESL